MAIAHGLRDEGAWLRKRTLGSPYAIWMKIIRNCSMTVILWNFSSDDDLIMRNICHESFHIAMSVCQFCNMSLGFKVGEDEHAAYIAGFAGDCVSEFINSKNTD